MESILLDFMELPEGYQLAIFLVLVAVLVVLLMLYFKKEEL